MWNASSTVVPVLLVTGAVGVGKTVVLHEADALLIEAGVSHATVELEEIARCWPEAIKGCRKAFAYRNLAALWPSFVAVGASRLLLSDLVEQRSELQLVSGRSRVRQSPSCGYTHRCRRSSNGSAGASLLLRMPTSTARGGGHDTSMRPGSRITWSRPRTGWWARSLVRCFGWLVGSLERSVTCSAC